MHKNTVTIATREPDGSIGARDVDGYQIDNTYEIGATVHRADFGAWMVTEDSTGYSMAHGNTRKEAVENFHKVVAKLGIETVRNQISAVLSK